MLITFPMTIIWWLLGVIAGISFAIIFYAIKNKRTVIGGVIEVDIQSNLCKFHVTSTELSNLKTKKVMFKVIHNVDLSREEQIL